ncbi:hypothetical protein EDD85DRAFT_810865 [Armillaria nabsnona]|nr:hypothetical protein EDD85DRAFT_810865 [Armillaria nabsnona]
MEPCLLLIPSLLLLLSRVFRTNLRVLLCTSTDETTGCCGVDIFSHGGYDATRRSITAVKDVLLSFSQNYSLHPFETIQRVKI